MLYHHLHLDAILPDDVSLLKEIFTQLVIERGLNRDCEDAEHIAVRLISLFQSGVHDREMLHEMASPACREESRPHPVSPSRSTLPHPSAPEPP